MTWGCREHIMLMRSSISIETKDLEPVYAALISFGTKKRTNDTFTFAMECMQVKEASHRLHTCSTDRGQPHPWS